MLAAQAASAATWLSSASKTSPEPFRSPKASETCFLAASMVTWPQIEMNIHYVSVNIYIYVYQCIYIVYYINYVYIYMNVYIYISVHIVCMYVCIYMNV